MRTSVIISLISTLTILNAAPDPDLRKAASDLLNQATSLENDANKILTGLDGLQTTFKQKSDAFDFGIPQNAKIAELDDNIKRYQTKRGIQSCIELKSDRIQVVTDELKYLLMKQITDQLNIDKITLNSIIQTLVSVSENLQGADLNFEIKNCENDRQRCRITYEYPVEVKHSQRAIEFIDTTSQAMMDTILQTGVNPILPARIDVEIYTPVMTCIQKL